MIWVVVGIQQEISLQREFTNVEGELVFFVTDKKVLKIDRASGSRAVGFRAGKIRR